MLPYLPLFLSRQGVLLNVASKKISKKNLTNSIITLYISISHEGEAPM
jgi:hypothetical protein